MPPKAPRRLMIPLTRMRPEKRLKIDFTWVLSGNVLYSACSWGIVVALAKLGSPERVGEYAFGLAVSTPIVLFANLQLRGLLVSDVKGQFNFGQYLTFRLITLAGAVGVVAGAAAWTQTEGRMRWIIVLCGLALAFDLVSDVYYGLMQARGRMDRIAVSLMLKGPLSLAALCTFMYFTRDTVLALTGLLLGRLTILLVWDTRLGFTKTGGNSPARLEWNTRGMGSLFRMALPLGVIQMLVALNVSIPRYFLEAHSGAADLGIFSAIASLLMAGNLVVSAFGQSIFLPVAQACAAGDSARFRRYAAMTASLGMLLGGAALLVLALFGRQLVSRVFRPEYGERGDLLTLLMIAGTIGFAASGLGYVATAARSLWQQIPMLVASASAGAITSAWSIPRHGLIGAAHATLVASVVQLVGAFVILWTVDRRLHLWARDRGAVLDSEELESSGVATV